METEQNDWITLKEEIKYDNPWIQVIHKDVINPSGKPGIYGQVNFKNLAIGILPIDKNDEIWLVGQYRFPLSEYSWEIPEGGCPIGEEPLNAAKRELKEETGLVAETYSMIGRIHTSNSVCNEQGYIFLAEDLRQEQAEPEETEQLKIRKLPLKEAVQMVMDSQITDSISIAAILKAARIRGY